MLPVLVSLLILGKCSRISKHDALLVMNLQNDFMEPMLYNHDTIPEYPIPDDQLFEWHGHNYTKPGALAVNHTTEIIEPINSLMRMFEKNGAPVVLSMNWHPENHCSFCRNGTEPTHDFCGPFGYDSKDFNITTACHDRISRKLLEYHMLMQFPDNCIQNDYGSRFSPYLEVSESMTVVKKAFFESFDAFTVWNGAISNSSYPFWNETESGEDLITRPSFGKFVKRNKVRRLFVVGLPLEADVLASSIDSLKHGVHEVVLITGLVPAIHNKTAHKAIDIMEKAGVTIVPCNATKIDDIMDAICSHGHHHPHPHHHHHPRRPRLPADVIAHESGDISEVSSSEDDDEHHDNDRNGRRFPSDWRWFAGAYSAGLCVCMCAYAVWRYTHRPRIVVGTQYNAVQ
jgi:nicotinamidase-related amidase